VEVSEWEAKKDIELTVKKARENIEERHAQKEREEHKNRLVQQGLAEVSGYLLQLKCEGEISSDEYWDSDFTANLRELVQNELELELSGNETSKQVRELVHEILIDELR
jgi:hypothetical protein